MSVSLLVSSGNGPGECRQAVAHILNRIVMDVGEEAVDIVCREAKHGPASAVLRLTGPDAERIAQAWEGVILWRCPSDLRSRHKRKNWFVQTYRLPEPAIAVDIDPKDVEMQAIRAGGPGGQHQNKTCSAIRARWGDYSVVVRDQRSQHQNRKLALERLEALVAADLEQGEAEAQGQLHWLHHQLERGNPKRIFEGPRFKEVLR